MVGFDDLGATFLGLLLVLIVATLAFLASFFTRMCYILQFGHKVKPIKRPNQQDMAMAISRSNLTPMPTNGREDLFNVVIWNPQLPPPTYDEIYREIKFPKQKNDS